MKIQYKIKIYMKLLGNVQRGSHMVSLKIKKMQPDVPYWCYKILAGNELKEIETTYINHELNKYQTFA